MPSPSDRRQQRRVQYLDPVQITLLGAFPPRVHALLAEDVSESGLAVNSPELFGVGANLLMELEVAMGTSIRLTGQVVWVVRANHQERYRLGVHFDALSDHARSELRRLVATRGRAR